MKFNLFFFTFFAATQPIYAGTNAIGNGGELLASRFIGVGNAIYQTLAAQKSNILTVQQMETFRESLVNIRVNAMTGPLKDNAGRIVDARYVATEDQATIEIDQQRWHAYFAARENLNLLVFHEYLRTIQVDDDNYKVSSQLSNFNRAIDEVSGLTSDGKLVVNELSDDFIYKDSSGANRDGKIVSIMGGFGYDYSLAGFAKVDLFLRRNQQIEFYFSSTGLMVKNHLVHEAIVFKQFLGNSFYLSGGLGARQFKFDEEETVLTNGRLVTVKSTQLQRDYTGEFDFGSQWQWRHLTIAVDWLGFSHPLVTLDESDSTQVKTSSHVGRLSIGVTL